MNKNTQEIAWVALALFFALVIAFTFYPSVEKGSKSTSDRLETVTTGGDWNPPSTWEPGK